MASIGIIANPQSGKDIRRLVSYATTIDNNEKVNICKRIVLAAYGIGIDKAVFMPDTFTMGYSVQYQLEDDKMPCCEIEVLDFDFEATMADTVQAAAMMEELGLACGGEMPEKNPHAFHFHRYQQRLSRYDGGHCRRNGRRCHRHDGRSLQRLHPRQTDSGLCQR